MPLRYILVFAVISFGFLYKVSAQELRNLNTSARALGMGNAYTPLVTHTDAIFYNPAGLAKNGGFTWRILDPEIGLSGLDEYESFADLNTENGFSDTLSQLTGSKVWINGAAKSAVVTPWFAGAYYLNSDSTIQINNPAVPEIDATTITDQGYAIAFGATIVPSVDLGMTFKRITRQGSSQTLESDYIGNLSGSDITDVLLYDGVGYSADLGINLTPGPLTVSLVWRDMGRTKFRNDDDTAPVPPSDEDNMIFGFGALIDAGLISISPNFEYQHLNRSDVQIGKKINLGLEIGLPLVDIRGGFHQGYYTLGAGIGLGPVQIDAATYGVEMGAFPGQLEDRRYVVQVILELGFDANLNFLGGSGGKDGKPASARSRGIKRRR